MRYYIVVHDIAHNIHKLLKFMQQSRTEKLILSSDGMYKYVNDKLYKFKLHATGKAMGTDGGKSSQLATAMSWKKYDVAYRIPIRHSVVTIATTEYKLHPKSSSKFCIEKLDSHIHDYYVESPLKLGDPSLSKDIDSFLSFLK